MDGTANTWLAILALSTLVETIVIIGVLVVAVVTMRRVSDQIARLQRDHVEPLAARLHAVADDVHDGIGRLQSADDEIRRVVARSATGAADAVKAARDRIWPAIGVARGVAAAVSFLARRLPRDLGVRERSRLPVVGRYPEGVRNVRH